MRRLIACLILSPVIASVGCGPGEPTSTSGFEQLPRDAPASISLVTRDELSTRPYHGVAEALGEVRGLDVDMAWDKTGAPSISIRGMLDGEPAVGVEVELTPGDTRYLDREGTQVLVTGEDGGFDVSWTAPGRCLLEASLRDDRASLPQAGERRLDYAATLETLPD